MAEQDNQPTATPDAIDIAMMNRALELAAQAAAIGEVPVGAVIYRGDEVLAEAYNLRESDRDPTAHAEMLALRAAAKSMASWRIEDCTLAVTLEPCPMCAGALVNARLPRLIYGTTDPKMGAVDTLFSLCTDPRLNHRLDVIAGVKAERCAAVLKAFFKACRSSTSPAKPSQSNSE